MNAEQPLLILADDFRLACRYAQENRLAPSCWRYVRDLSDVRGRHGGRYVVLTIPDRKRSWAEIQARQDMLQVLRMHGFTPID